MKSDAILLFILDDSGVFEKGGKVGKEQVISDSKRQKTENENKENRKRKAAKRKTVERVGLWQGVGHI